MDTWKCLIKNWHETKIETATFFFSQSEKMLESTNFVNQELISKAHKIIVILMPLISAGIGYLLKLISDKAFFTPQAGGIIAFIISLTVSMYFSVKVWIPKTEFFKGSEPKKIMSPSFIESENLKEGNLQTLAVIYNECEMYQERINSNIGCNLGYRTLLNSSIKWFVFSPFLALISYLIVTFLSQVSLHHS